MTIPTHDATRSGTRGDCPDGGANRRLLHYGRLGDDLVLLPPTKLASLAGFFEILGSARTFGDYLQRCDEAPAGVAYYAVWYEEGDCDPDDIPALDQPFDVDAIPGRGDGYFPPNVQMVMLDALDDELWEVLAPFATVHDDMGGIPWVQVPWSELGHLEAAFRAAGIELIERQDDVDMVAPW